MGKTITRTITIPADNDGYILMSCPECGEVFKLKVSDIHDEGVLNLYCPACGFSSYSVSDFTNEDVERYVEQLTENVAYDLVNDLLKPLEKEIKKINRNSKGLFSIIFKREHTKKPGRPLPLYTIIDALKPAYCPQCGRYAKVKMLLRESSYCCPLCGVQIYSE